MVLNVNCRFFHENCQFFEGFEIPEIQGSLIPLLFKTPVKTPEPMILSDSKIIWKTRTSGYPQNQIPGQPYSLRAMTEILLAFFFILGTIEIKSICKPNECTHKRLNLQSTQIPNQNLPYKQLAKFGF
jgi:hypothetical protein